NLVNLLIQQRGLSAMRFSIGLGNTPIAGTASVTKKRPRRVEAVVVGVSSRAMPVGVTMPIQYLQRWNKEYMGEEAASSYSSIIVTLNDRNKIAPFSQWLVDEQGLRLEDSLGERFATVIFVIRLLFLIISVAILVIAVINIGHNFFIQVSERRREIGILRAVGATRRQMLAVFLMQGVIVGAAGALLGSGLGLMLVALFSRILRTSEGEPLFSLTFDFGLIGIVVLASTLLGLLAAALPARNAARLDPAQAIRG
ncbi:MAG: FtsX-like permease family protein, partial [Burkholderiales bacterium]|nr:FtsX-like permease family protein [Burkholderiales bacterium]